MSIQIANADESKIVDLSAAIIVHQDETKIIALINADEFYTNDTTIDIFDTSGLYIGATHGGMIKTKSHTIRTSEYCLALKDKQLLVTFEL